MKKILFLITVFASLAQLNLFSLDKTQAENACFACSVCKKNIESASSLHSTAFGSYLCDECFQPADKDKKAPVKTVECGSCGLFVKMLWKARLIDGAPDLDCCNACLHEFKSMQKKSEMRGTQNPVIKNCAHGVNKSEVCTACLAHKEQKNNGFFEKSKNPLFILGTIAVVIYGIKRLLRK